MKALAAGLELCPEIADSAPVRPFLKQEVMPGRMKGAALENHIRDNPISWWHQTCTAKMGRDTMSVVDGNLKVYGFENLRIADGSIMPRVTTAIPYPLRHYRRARRGDSPLAASDLMLAESVG